MKTLLATFVLWIAFASDAWATAQFEERIRIGGREFNLHSIPLLPWLEVEESRGAFIPENRCSALWRGYRGTWELECGRLYLVGLEIWGDKPGLATPWESVPLERAFHRPGRRVFASWFSGTLRVIDGHRLTYVHMGFGSVFETTTEIEVVRGCVKSIRKRTWHDAAMTSIKDRQWVAIRDVDEPDRLDWDDAREVGHPAWRLITPQGTSFRTRGIYVRAKGKAPARLWVHETMATAEVFLPLLGDVPDAPERSFAHVEVEASWTTTEEHGFALRVHALRELPAGRSMHHPRFDIDRARRMKLLDEEALAALEFANPRVVQATEVGAWDDVLGLSIELWGRYRSTGRVGLAETDPPWSEESDLPPIEIAPVQAPPGAEIVVVGVVRKWVVTEAMLRRCPRRYAAFASRGAGTYYRLVDPRTGRLAVPRKVP